jgi:ATP-dependent protease ClpP protease subunit
MTAIGSNGTFCLGRPGIDAGGVVATPPVSTFSNRGLAAIRSPERAEDDFEILRAKYGKPAAGRAIVRMFADRIEDDVDRVLAEVKSASARNCREMVILIDSPGGRLKDGLCEAISAFKGKSIGVVVGRCSSAATFVLASCQERVAPEGAEFLVHCCGYYRDGRYQYDPSRWTAREHARAADAMLDRDQKLAAVYLKTTGSQDLVDMMYSNEDHRLTAAQARRHNLITKIEPAPKYVAGDFMSAFFRPRVKRANAALAKANRLSGNAGKPYAYLNISGTIGRPGARAADVRRTLATAPFANTILAHFDTAGGSVAEAFEMAAAIMEHPAERKKAVILGQCLSAGVVPLLAFDLRVANPKAEILLHKCEVIPASQDRRRWTAEALADAATVAETSDREILDLLASRTGYDREFFARDLATETPMRLDDALKAGLIHEISGVTPSCDKNWPAAAAALRASGAIMGLPSYMMTPNFATACSSAISVAGPTLGRFA